MRLVLVLIATAAVIAGAVTASSGSARTSLRLHVSSAGLTHSATLRCDPTGGTHRHRAAACRALAAAGGRFSRLKGHPHEICPDIFAPVTASATGTYRGRRVNFRHTYPNSCVLDRATAPVFAL